MRCRWWSARVPGCVDAVQDGITGTLVTMRNPDAFGGGHPPLSSQSALAHGEAGQAQVLRDFRPEAMREALYEEYMRLLQERGLVAPQPSQSVALCATTPREAPVGGG